MSESNANDFFRAYAVSLLVWQHVETALFTFFHGLMNGTDLKRTGALYYSQDAFGGKLKLVDATAKVVLTQGQLDQWKKLTVRMVKAYRQRNVLAHFTAVANNGESTALELVLAPPAFVPSELVRNRAKFDADQCDKLTELFTELAQDLNTFASDRKI